MNRKEQVHQTDVETRALAVAQEIVKGASKLVLPYWPNPLNRDFDATKIMEIFDKKQGVGNYATAADFASETYIIGRIRQEFPHHTIIAEESDAKLHKSPWRWFVDPIDGTLNFRNGLPDFGILIGVLKDNEPVVGILAMPAYQTYICARIGHGAILSSFDGRVRKDLATIPNLQTQPMDKTLIGFDVAYEQRGQQFQRYVEKIADRIGYAASYAGIAAGNYRLAQGLLGGYFVGYTWQWDVAAASVIIPEVGGVVSDMQGHPIDWSNPNPSFLAARTPLIHQKLLEMLNE